MILNRLTYYPNGRLDAERVETDNIDQATILPFEELFNAGPSFDAIMPHASEVAVKWTGSHDGQALMTCSYEGQVFLSGVLVAAIDGKGDAELLQMFTKSLESIPLLQHVTAGRTNPFAALHERPERPLLGVVVWPTLPADKFEELMGIELLLSTVFLRRFGRQ